MRVAPYLRVSTDRQEREATVETQRDHTLEWIERGGHELVGPYVDTDVSGTVPMEERPAGARLLRDAARGKFDMVLVHHLDRWGRDREHFPRDLRLLEETGAEIQSVCEPVDNKSPQGKYILYNWVNFAAMERDLIRQRTMDGSRRVAKEAARFMGGPIPFGYRVENKLFVPDTEPLPGFPWSEADIVRMMVQWALAERAPDSRIAARLTAMGIPTPIQSSGPGKERKNFKKDEVLGHWRAATVRGILTNPMIAGTRYYGKTKQNPKCKAPKGDRHSHPRSRPGEREPRRLKTKPEEQIACAVPALISEGQFAALPEVRQGNQTYRTPRVKRDYLLQGLMFCGVCGRRYGGSPLGGSKGEPGAYGYYCCPARRQHNAVLGPDAPPCPAPNVRVEQADAQVWEIVLQHLLDLDGTLARLRDQLVEGEREWGSLLEVRDGMRRALDKKQQERRKTVDLVVGEVITEQDGREKLERLEKEEEELKGRLEELDDRAISREEQEGRLLQAETLLREWHEQMDREFTSDEKRRLLWTFVESVWASEVAGEKRLRVRLVFDRPGCAKSDETALPTSTP